MAALTAPDFPPEMIESVAIDAEIDADRAVRFLTCVGLGPPPGGTRKLPADFLMNLGAALRLLHWEAAGIFAHRTGGLPAAEDAVRQVFVEAAAGIGRNDPPDLSLSQAVFRLSVDRFAWAGRRDLMADVEIETHDEDALVEALAQFIWTHRADDFITE